MYRRYKPKRKNSGHALPIAAVSLTLITLLIWGYFAVGDDIADYFKGKTVVVADASEANGKMDSLMADLFGSRQQLLVLIYFCFLLRLLLSFQYFLYQHLRLF